MNMRRFRFAALAAALMLYPAGLLSQLPFETLIFVSVTQVGNSSTDNVCGLKVGGTYCNDPAIGESGLPPKPPVGIFDVRFVDHRSEPCLDQGQKLHLQGYEAPKDTFRLDFQKGDGAYNFVITWSRYVNGPDWYALRMEDALGLGLINVDMLTDPDRSVTITQSFIGAVYIIGTLLPDDVRPEGDLTPDVFALHQNYPNPFNPSTTIKFAVRTESSVDLSVFNILGERVATLTSATLQPGFYTSDWAGTDDNGTTVAGGMYYVRMTAANGTHTSFSSVKKLILMK